jgi:hypothetical protein
MLKKLKIELNDIRFLPSAGMDVETSGKSPFNCNSKTINDKNRDIPKDIFSPASLGTKKDTRIRTACIVVGTMYKVLR